MFSPLRLLLPCEVLQGSSLLLDFLGRRYTYWEWKNGGEVPPFLPAAKLSFGGMTCVSKYRILSHPVPSYIHLQL